MTIHGRVKKGKVVLDDPQALPDGTEVVVRAIKKQRKPAKPAKARKPSKPTKRPRSLAERMAPFLGKAKGLPHDMSVNLDHYLYGLPKRK